MYVVSIAKDFMKNNQYEFLIHHRHRLNSLILNVRVIL